MGTIFWKESSWFKGGCWDNEIFKPNLYYFLMFEKYQLYQHTYLNGAYLLGTVQFRIEIAILM